MTAFRRSAFSLVELLIVMAIILVLVSILLPAVGSARSLAQRTTCQNNVRELLMATQQYVINDPEGRMPYPNWGGSFGATNWDSPTAPGWLYTYPHYGTTPDDMQTGTIWKYIQDERVYHCPLHVPPYLGPSNEFCQNITSYIVNGAVCGYGNKRSIPCYAWSSMWKPSESMYLFECATYGEAVTNGAAVTAANTPGGYWNDGASYPNQNSLSNRHGTGASVGFFDWHVEYFDVNGYQFLLTQYPGPLWCNPGTVHNGTSSAGS
jgi:prepilin-type N-terminal cleavage/methylation domain-containing protein/prepilin-type processing-associated H-X9-DG protein